MSKKDDTAADAKAAGAGASRRSAASRSRSNSRLSDDVAFVEALAKILRDNELAEIEVSREYGEDDELTIRLCKHGAQMFAAPAAANLAPMAIQAPPQALPGPAPAGDGDAAGRPDPADDPGCVPSPMVGTVYLSPEPDAAPFVKVGDTVEAGQTLLIVEAMKTMNLIPSPKGGKIREILVTNGQPVEYGAPLLLLD